MPTSRDSCRGDKRSHRTVRNAAQNSTGCDRDRSTAFDAISGRAMTKHRPAHTSILGIEWLIVQYIMDHILVHFFARVPSRKSARTQAEKRPRLRARSTTGGPNRGAPVRRGGGYSGRHEKRQNGVLRGVACRGCHRRVSAQSAARDWRRPGRRNDGPRLAGRP